ncbi:hypothetical protein FPV67DRAFT_642501 [Lyophyllum atratum]|nr:hypothetical protein FPV67DRAFT_642501 [Lyophyllum atratum]
MLCCHDLHRFIYRSKESLSIVFFSYKSTLIEPLPRIPYPCPRPCSYRPDITHRMTPQVYFTRHPRYINERALEFVESLLVESGQNHKVRCKTVEDVAETLYTAATDPFFSRTTALIARSIVTELFWTDKELSTVLQEELDDLVAANFITTWMNEFSRGCSHNGRLCPTLDDLASQLEDVRFNQSNPRLEESTTEDLYLDELDITDYEGLCPGLMHTTTTARIPGPSTKLDRTPTQTTINLPLQAEETCPEEGCRSASILLSDFYSMGLVHPDVMQRCILYIIDNLCLVSDVRCLHILLDRGATYLAPSLGLTFLRICHRNIMLAGATMLKDDTSEVLELLKLIDDIITNDMEFSKAENVASYAQRACHRWDSTLRCDFSNQPNSTR